MLLKENQIITKAISNLENNFKEIKSLLPNNPDYKKLYNNLFVDYRELLGKKVWLNNDFEFEKELVFEFIDLDENVKSLLNNLKNG